MEFNLKRSLEILQATPSVLEKHLTGLSKGWLSQNEGDGTWTPAEVVCHLIHCEEDDWVTRVKIILNDKGDRKFKPFDRTKGFEMRKTKSISELINEFKFLRNENLKYLISLNLAESDLVKTGIHPEFGEVTLKQLISTWVVHDLSHIAQINRIMAKQYSDEVGPWAAFLPILNKQITQDNKNFSLGPDWSEYYKNKSNQVPREILTKVLELFKAEKSNEEQLFAIDVGSGHGSDTLELLKQNWKVMAVDYNAEGLSILKESVLPSQRRNLSISQQSFHEIKLGKCNLLNASYSIPFCQPEYFNAFWKEIENSILKDGRFAGNFFGINDSWAGDKSMTFLTKEKVQALFDKFKIEYFDERDEDGTTSDGTKKHWHVFSVIAKKL